MSEPRSDLQVRVETYHEFQGILEQQAQEPIHNDPVIAACSRALLDLTQEPDLKDLFIDQIFKHMQGKSKLEALNVNNLAIRSINRCLMHPEPDLTIDYPDASFDKPDTFRWLLPDILGILPPYSPRKGDRFYSDMIWREVQSNKAKRYETIPLLRVMFPEEFAEASILDVGCSQNQGLKQLALQIPFGEVGVADGTGQLPRDDIRAIRTAFNQQLQRPDFVLKESWGTDFFDLSDVEGREWVEACSLIPSELRQPDVVQQYRFLQSVNPSNVHFKMSDFAMTVKPPRNPSDTRYMFDMPGKTFDIVSFMTMLYQVPAHERTIMFDHALQYSNRFIIVQDAAKRIKNPKGDHPMDGLAFDPKQFNKTFGYRLFVYDKDHPDHGFQELARLSSGRGDIIQLVDTSLMALHGLKNLLGRV